MTIPDFAVEEQHQDGQVRLSLFGELDLKTARALEDRLHGLAFTSRVVLLDLSRLDFIDSSGLRVIMRALQEARHDGRQLQVEPNLSSSVRLTLKLAGLHDYLVGGETRAVESA